MTTATAKRGTKKAKSETKNGSSETAPQEPIVLGKVPKGKYAVIEISLIDDPPGEADRMPRPGDEERIAETARSLREVGQLQPIMVEESAAKAGRYVRVFGRRRLAAARINKAETIGAIVVPPLEPDVRRTIVAVENIQRQDLSPAEEHLAVAELLELVAIDAALSVGGNIKTGIHGRAMSAAEAAALRQEATQSDKGRRHVAAISHDLLLDHRVRGRACEIVAAMLAKSPTWVRDRMYVGRFEAPARALILAGKLPIVHAREIAKVADPVIRAELAENFAIGGIHATADEAGQLEDLRGLVSERLFNLKVVPWKLAAAFADCPPCDGCPSNSATNPGLFDHGGEVSAEMRGGVGMGLQEEGKKLDAVCTDHRCYAKKQRATTAAVATAAKKVLEKEDVSPRTIAFVNPKAISDKVEARKELAGHNDGRAGKVGKKPSGKELAKRARAEAEGAWLKVMRERAEKIVEEVEKLIDKKPGSRAIFTLFQSTRIYDEASRGWNLKKAQKAIKGTLFTRLLKAAANPSWKSVGEIEKHLYAAESIETYSAATSGFVDAIAKAFGVKCPAAPKVEEFIKAKNGGEEE